MWIVKQPTYPQVSKLQNFLLLNVEAFANFIPSKWIVCKIGTAMLAHQQFKLLFQNCSSFLQNFKSATLSPSCEKTMKQWNITSASKMVNRTSQTIRTHEAKGDLPKARMIENGKRLERIYSLEDINRIRDFYGTRRHKPEKKEPAIIAVANFKGGVTKSTTSEQQAHNFAIKGYRVLFIDADPQGTSTAKQGKIPDRDVSPDETLLNLLTNYDSDIKKCIFKTHIDGLDMIPSNLSLYNAELMIPTELAHAREKTNRFYQRLKNSLETVQDEYDIIIVDCPPSCGFITMNVLYAANAVLIPMAPTLDDFASTTQFFNMVHETLERISPQKYNFVRILVSKYQAQHQSSKELVAVLQHVLGEYLAKSKMISSEAVIRASAEFKSIFEVTPHPNDRRTFNRALEAVGEINNELEKLIINAWSISNSHANENHFQNKEVEA